MHQKGYYEAFPKVKYVEENLSQESGSRSEEGRELRRNIQK